LRPARVPEIKDDRVAHRPAPRVEGVRALLVTTRPALHDFFAALAAVDLVDASVEELARHRARVEAATVGVVDVSIDPARALDICTAFAGLRPELPVAAVVCCAQAVTPRTLRSLVAAGVTSVLDLQASREETARALRTLSEGGSVVNLHLRRGQRAFLHETVTGREPKGDAKLRLLELVAYGLSDNEIGQRLHLSPHTVKHHIESLRAEVGVRNRTELAAWAGRYGFYAQEARRTRL
jgi:DNA-binding NarL/FixJ family response regulator